MSYELDKVSDAQRALEVSRAELTTAVIEARKAGASWRDLAKRLGVSRQAVQRKYGSCWWEADEPPLDDPMMDPLWTTPDK